MSRRILVVTKNVPWPANSGEKQRTLGMVRALAGTGDVTVVAFADEHDDPELASREGIRVRSLPQPRRGPVALAAASLGRRSITSAKWHSPRLAAMVEEEVRGGVDLVVVEHAQLAHYLPSDLPTGVGTVLDMHNIESLLTRRQSRTMRSWKRLPVLLESVALARLERRAMSRFDVVAVVSDADRTALAAVGHHGSVEVVPNAYTVAGAPLAPSETPTACFVGLLSWAPNADAAVAFTQGVWPRVRAQMPEARLLLVGRNPTPAVRDLAGEDVVVTGTVDSLEPWYQQSRVALAPLLAGGGSRLKILEALAYGRPVLATTIGAEGLEDLVGRGVEVRDGDEALARALVELLTDDERSRSLGAAGADAVRRDHSWQRATRGLLESVGVILDARA